MKTTVGVWLHTVALSYFRRSTVMVLGLLPKNFRQTKARRRRMTIAPHEDPHRTPEENDGDDDENDDGCNRDTMPTTKTRMTFPFAYIGRVS